MNSLNNFYKYLEINKNLSPYTIRNYSNDLSDFFKFLKEKNISKIQKISKLIIREYLSLLIEKNYKKKSIARKLSIIRSYLRYLKTKNIISENHAELIHAPKSTKTLPEIIEKKEMKKLLEAPKFDTINGARDRAILEIFYSTGIRVSEMHNIDINHVDFNLKKIQILGKGSKYRLVLYGNKCQESLENYTNYFRNKLIINSKNSTALFLNKYGSRLSVRSIQRIVKKYMTISGINNNAHTHSLRHTFATHLIEGGADIKVVQDLLGHESPTTTQIYTHTSAKHTKEAYFRSHPKAKMDIK
ncbi:MAG: recombinase XerC [Chloroflexi bacterium]|nr:recombinase XerC [Chloroflexota bacterium]